MNSRPLSVRRLIFWWVLVPLALWAMGSLLIMTNPTYRAERLLWPCDVATKKILRDPGSFPPAALQRTLRQLQSVMARYPGSTIAAKAQLLIGQIHYAQGEFDVARQELRKIWEQYPASQFGIQAYKVTALTYVKQEDWNKAMDTYRLLLSRFPSDPRVLEVPLMMAELGRHFPDAGEAALQEAIAHYQQLLKAKPKEPAAFTARQLLADCYRRAGRWKEMVQELETLVMSYPWRREVPLWLKLVEELGRDRLHDSGMARDLAARFVERYPNRRRLVEHWLGLPPGPVAAFSALESQ